MEANFQTILILAAVVEAVVSLLMSVYVHDETKPFYARIQWKLILSIGVGQAVAFGFQVDFMSILNLPTHFLPINLILTGLILGRGSNLVHDLISLIKTYKEVQQFKLK